MFDGPERCWGIACFRDVGRAVVRDRVPSPGHFRDRAVDCDHDHEERSARDEASCLVVRYAAAGTCAIDIAIVGIVAVVVAGAVAISIFDAIENARTGVFTMTSEQEYVNLYTFEVGEGEMAMEMVARGATEAEARTVIEARLQHYGMTRPIALQSVRERVCVRTYQRAGP